jgi:hypothetical protein
MSRGTVSRSWKRHHWAYIACGLWILGFDVVPLAHEVFHDSLDDHVHGHHHDSQHGHRHEGDPEKEKETPAEHGQGSVAHRDLAAQIPVASVPVVQEALLSWSAPAIRAHDERPADRQPRTTKARGPPAQTV